MRQTSSHPAADAARMADQFDALELWRAADRLARHAEVRLPRQAAAPVAAGAADPEVDEARALRRKANELLHAALGDGGHGARASPQANKARRP